MFSTIASLSCLLVVAAAVQPKQGYGTPNVDQFISSISSRIVGGVEATPHEFPHIVSLQLLGRHFCGGSIINENWVLTAGHCVRRDDVNLVVRAGKHWVKKTEESEQNVEVIKVIVHENFQGIVKPDDIALLKLKEPLVFNEYVQPISLPKQDSEVEGDVNIAGWGSTQPNDSGYPKKLLKANLSIIDLYTCKEAFKFLILEPAPLVDTHLCTGPLTGGLSPCGGDSGGPLSKHENGKTELVGIISWGYYPCGTQGAPSVYTKVSSYVDWIENNIAKNSN